MAAACELADTRPRRPRRACLLVRPANHRSARAGWRLFHRVGGLPCVTPCWPTGRASRLLRRDPLSPGAGPQPQPPLGSPLSASNAGARGPALRRASRPVWPAIAGSTRLRGQRRIRHADRRLRQRGRELCSAGGGTAHPASMRQEMQCETFMAHGLGASRRAQWRAGRPSKAKMVCAPWHTQYGHPAAPVAQLIASDDD